MLNLYAWSVYIYMKLFDVWIELMKNDVVVVKLWMISWLNVVVVVMGCVVDELMHWVFTIVDWWCELSCCWKFWWNFVELCWNDVLISSFV